MDLTSQLCGYTASGEPVAEMFENQRYWGIMWGPPIPSFDWPNWSNAKGAAVHLTRTPSIDGEGGWFVVRMPSTDEDGWVYGTSFDRLDQPRPGGRASKRVNDHIRSRVWRKLNADQELQPLVAERLEVAAATAAAAAAARNTPAHAQISSSQILSALTNNIVYKQLPKPSVFKIWQILMDLWNESAKRHGLLKVVPLDPVGLYFAVKQHSKLATSQRNHALSRGRILLHAPFSPSPPSESSAPQQQQQQQQQQQKQQQEQEQQQQQQHISRPESRQHLSPGSTQVVHPGQQHPQQQQQQQQRQLLRYPSSSSSASLLHGPSSMAAAHPTPPGFPTCRRLPPTPLSNLVNVALPSVSEGSTQQQQQQQQQQPLLAASGSLERMQQQQQQQQQRLGLASSAPATMQVPLPACTRSLTIPARCKEGGAHSLGSGRSSSMPYQDGVTSPSHPETSTAQVRDHGQQLATQQQQQQQQQQHCAQQQTGQEIAALQPNVAAASSRTSPPPTFTPSAFPSPLSLSLAPTTAWASNTVASLGGAWSALFKGERAPQQEQTLSQQQQQSNQFQEGELPPPQQQQQLQQGVGAPQHTGPSNDVSQRPIPSSEQTQAHHQPRLPCHNQQQKQGRQQQEKQQRALLPDLDDPLQLSQELVTILNYTRAAYGYVMAAGHMSSISSLLHMVSTSAFFNPVSGASEEANTEAIFTLTGIPQEDVVLTQWRNHVFRPCHFLAVDRRHKRLVLCIRGSLELGDICTDLAAQPAAWCLGSLGACTVHQGLISAATYVLQSTRDALVATAAAHPDWPVLITGHSLGAGVAALIVLMVRHGDSPLSEPSTAPQQGPQNHGHTQHPAPRDPAPAAPLSPPPPRSHHRTDGTGSSIEPPGAAPAAPPGTAASARVAAAVESPSGNAAGAPVDAAAGAARTADQRGTDACAWPSKGSASEASPSASTGPHPGAGIDTRAGPSTSKGPCPSGVAGSSTRAGPQTKASPSPGAEPSPYAGPWPKASLGGWCNQAGAGSSTVGGQRWWPEDIAARAYCVGVACPPVVSEHAARACEAYVVCLAHHMDFVPRLSHYSVEVALLEMVRCSPAAQLAGSFLSTPLGAAVTASFGGKDEREREQGERGRLDGRGGRASANGSASTGGQQQQGRRGEAGRSGGADGSGSGRGKSWWGGWEAGSDSEWEVCDSPPTLTFSSSAPNALGVIGRCSSLPSASMGQGHSGAGLAAHGSANAGLVGVAAIQPEIELIRQSNANPPQAQQQQQQQQQQQVRRSQSSMCLSGAANTPPQAPQPQGLPTAGSSEAGIDESPHSQNINVGDRPNSANKVGGDHQSHATEAQTRFSELQGAQQHVQQTHFKGLLGSHEHQQQQQEQEQEQQLRQKMPPPLPWTVVDVMARGSGRGGSTQQQQQQQQQQQEGQEHGSQDQAPQQQVQPELQAAPQNREGARHQGHPQQQPQLQQQQQVLGQGEDGSEQEGRLDLQRSASEASKGSGGSGEEELGLFSCWGDVLGAMAKEARELEQGKQQQQQQQKGHSSPPVGSGVSAPWGPGTKGEVAEWTQHATGRAEDATAGAGGGDAAAAVGVHSESAKLSWSGPRSGGGVGSPGVPGTADTLHQGCSVGEHLGSSPNMQPSSTSSGSVTGTCHNSSSPDKHWSGTRGLGWWHATPQGSASKDDARTNREPHTPSTPPQAASTRSPRHTHPLVDSSSPESAPTGPPTQAASPSHSQPTHHAPADSVRTAAHNPSALHSYTDPASVGMQHVLPAEPGGPGAEQLPHTPMQAVSQSLDDLADALQEQQQQRRQRQQQQEGRQREGVSSQQQEQAPPLSQEQLAQQLEAIKLYVPGRVLWMTYEEEPQLRRLLARRARRQRLQQGQHLRQQQHQHPQKLQQQQQQQEQEQQQEGSPTAPRPHAQQQQQQQGHSFGTHHVAPHPGPHIDLTCNTAEPVRQATSSSSSSSSYPAAPQHQYQQYQQQHCQQQQHVLPHNAQQSHCPQKQLHAAQPTTCPAVATPSTAATGTRGTFIPAAVPGHLECGRLAPPQPVARQGPPGVVDSHGLPDGARALEPAESTGSVGGSLSAGTEGRGAVTGGVDGGSGSRNGIGAEAVGLDGLVMCNNAGRSSGKERGCRGGVGRSGSGTLSSRLYKGLQRVRASVESAIGNFGGGEDSSGGSDDSDGGGCSGSSEGEVGWDGEWNLPWMSDRGSGGKEGGKAGTKKQQQRVVLVEVDRHLFEQLSLVPSCAGDHIPDVYLAALRALHTEALLASRQPAPGCAHSAVHPHFHQNQHNHAQRAGVSSTVQGQQQQQYHLQLSSAVTRGTVPEQATQQRPTELRVFSRSTSNDTSCNNNNNKNNSNNNTLPPAHDADAAATAVGGGSTAAQGRSDRQRVAGGCGYDAPAAAEVAAGKGCRQEGGQETPRADRIGHGSSSDSSNSGSNAWWLPAD